MSVTTRKQELVIGLDVCEGLFDGRWELVDAFEDTEWQYIITRRTGRDGPAPLPLSWRERQVVRLALHGHSNHVIADRLSVAPATVATHIRRALRKLRLQSRLELIRFLPDLLVREEICRLKGKLK